MCPYCHNRVRLKRHPHDLPRKSLLTSDKMVGDPKTLQEFTNAWNEDAAGITKKRKNNS